MSVDEEVTTKPELVYRSLMFPKDLNPAGNVFGGNIMSIMDECAAIYTRNYPGRFVTRAVDNINFTVPVESGDELLGYAQTCGEGLTSLSVLVNLYKKVPNSQDPIPVTRAVFTMVCVDEEGRKIAWKNWTN